MDSLGKMLLWILIVDAIVFLGQIALININPESPTIFYTDSHLLSQYNTGDACSPSNYGNCTLETMSNSSNRLPSAQSVGEAGVFTDIYNTIRGWIFTAGQGLELVVQIFGAPYYLLKSIIKSVEYNVVVYTLGALWYGLTLFLVVAWLFDRR